MSNKHAADDKPNRCVHIKKDGTRCRRFAQAGLDRCTTPGHGGTSKGYKAKAVAARTQAVLVRKGYGQGLVDENHPGANPVTGLAWELRRTAYNIEFLQDKIASLSDPDIIFGRTVEERKDAEVNVGPGGQVSDGSYNLVRDEARVNLWVALHLKERTHYKDLCKLAIAAGFEDRRIRMQEEQILQINNVIGNIISALGKDPNDPEIRRMVRDQFMLIAGGD